jgi:hypothetical protein
MVVIIILGEILHFSGFCPRRYKGREGGSIDYYNSAFETTPLVTLLTSHLLYDDYIIMAPSQKMDTIMYNQQAATTLFIVVVVVTRE